MSRREIAERILSGGYPVPAPMKSGRGRVRWFESYRATYQVTTVRPYYRNVGKRLVKRPKLYFSDAGLATHLTASEDWDLLERQGRAGASGLPQPLHAEGGGTSGSILEIRSGRSR